MWLSNILHSSFMIPWQMIFELGQTIFPSCLPLLVWHAHLPPKWYFLTGDFSLKGTFSYGRNRTQYCKYDFCPKGVYFETHTPFGDQQQRIIYRANNCIFFHKIHCFHLPGGHHFEKKRIPGRASLGLPQPHSDLNFDMSFTNLPTSAEIYI